MASFASKWSLQPPNSHCFQGKSKYLKVMRIKRNKSGENNAFQGMFSLSLFFFLLKDQNEMILKYCIIFI